MSPIKRTLARKAVKSTAKHTAHGAAARLKRKPPRAIALVGLGGLAGLLAGWGLARVSAAGVRGSEPA